MLAYATSRTLERLSPSLREAGHALGAPSWRTLIQISMRAAAPGILSAGLLAVARVAGRVAPLLLVMPANTEASSAALMPTLHVEAYRLLLTSDPQAPSLAWTAALLLTVASRPSYGLLAASVTSMGRRTERWHSRPSIGPRFVCRT